MTALHPSPYAAALLREWEHEALNTLMVLESLPEKWYAWKPSDKSRGLFDLAAHIADSVSLIPHVLETNGVDLASYTYPETKVNNRNDMLQLFQDNQQLAVKALQAVPSDAVWDETWTMRTGEAIHFERSRKLTLRTMALNHIYHHRGQLTVYLRLLNERVYGLYGPSADDKADLGSKS